jgi:hypothetical protein
MKHKILRILYLDTDDLKKSKENIIIKAQHFNTKLMSHWLFKTDKPVLFGGAAVTFHHHHLGSI